MLKLFTLLLTLVAWQVNAQEQSQYFERPLSCPLRFSQLSSLRDQIQTLNASLGTECTQTGQQAISQLTSNVASLETITNSFNNYSSSANAYSSAQYAKNVGQIIGSINLITSNNACFYDIKSRGLLPVLSDVVMSVSQLGLLFTATPGAVFASAGYIVGSSIKIIDGLLKTKFNFSKPEERKAFIQLNCAFFETRRMMDEFGIFNPETEDFREQIVQSLREERINLIKFQKLKEAKTAQLEGLLTSTVYNIPRAQTSGLDPALLQKLEEVSGALSIKAPDYSEKLKQVSVLSGRALDIIKGIALVKIDKKTDTSIELLRYHLERIVPELVRGGKLWTGTIDEFEIQARGPILAFITPVRDSIKKELFAIEAEYAITNPQASKQIINLRNEIQSMQKSSWAINLRLSTLKAKIENLERRSTTLLFSDSDEGASNEVDILEYYRKLQNSILGREGRAYIKNSIRKSKQMQEGLEAQLELLTNAVSTQEKCSAAEKTRLAWAQYRYKVEEGYDFVSTNLDLFRSNFKIGKEKLNRSTKYVLAQIESVEEIKAGKAPGKETLGSYVQDIKNRVQSVESRLKQSGCF